MSALIIGDINCAENEFLAEDELITITPKFDHEIYHFISGNFGPLEADINIDVPLWLAIALRRRDRCVIVPPLWLSVESLQRIIEEEKDSNTPQLTNIMFHYAEIANLLLTNAAVDIPHSDHVQSLLQDLQSIRMDSIKTGFTAMAGTVREELVEAGRLNNVGAIELHSFRRFLVESMSVFQRLTDKKQDEETGGESTGGGGGRPGAGPGQRKLPRFKK